MKELIDTAVPIFEQLHFLRADWFYAFIPLVFFLLLSLKKNLNDKRWQDVIDPQLQPFVLTSTTEGRQRRYPLLLAFIAASLCITALAGPVYKQLPQPVYREQSSLVVLLDLSQSMNATDIKPSRLERAKLELLDILNTRKTGQTALVVYAADAFVVTPLTDDNATIANLVPSLVTEMMPSQGSNLSAALSKTFSLLTQAGIISGDILIITDDIHERDEKAIKKVTSLGHRLSIFGIGTAEGGPVPLDGGFLLDSDGAIVIPKLASGKLQRYALEGGGLYTGIRANDSDIDKLGRLFQSSELEKNAGKNDLNADIWQEEGHWLLLPLLLLAALWSRKGWISVTIPFVLGLSLSTLPQPVHAETLEQQRPLIDTGHLWSSPDQKAMKAFEQGKNEEAAEQFTNPDWKASALYRNGDYEAALEALQQSSSSDALYNKGNALARLGRYEEAIKAYDEAIEKDTGNSDAQFNREQVKKALDEQKQNQQQQQDQQQDGEPGDSENKDSQQGEDSDQNKDQQDGEQQEGEQQEGQQDPQQQPGLESEQKSEQQSGDDKQQQAEDEQLKQRDAEAEKQQQEKEQQQYEQDIKDSKEKDGDQQEPSSDDQAQQEQQEDQKIENRDGEEKPAEIEINPVEASITEEEKATEQWLKRIPDDPGGLLRRKFYYQYNQAPGQNDEQQPW